MTYSQEEKIFQHKVMNELKDLGYVGLPTGEGSTIDEIVVSLDDCWKILALIDFKHELTLLKNGSRQSRSVAQKSQVDCFISPWSEKFYFIIANRDDTYIIVNKIGHTPILGKCKDGRSTLKFTSDWKDKAKKEIKDGNIIIVDDFNKLISELVKLLK